MRFSCAPFSRRWLFRIASISGKCHVTSSPSEPGSEIQLAGRRFTSIREFLAFKLGCEEYGIDILRVPEIRSHEHPTRMANAPAFVKGVINQLRPVPEFSSVIGAEMGRVAPTLQ